MYEVSHLLRIRLLTMTDVKLFHSQLIFDQIEVELINEVNTWINYIRNNMFLEGWKYKTEAGPYAGVFPANVVIDDSDSKVVVDFCIDKIQLIYNNSYKDWF